MNNYLIQRVHKGLTESGDDFYETLGAGFPTAEGALGNIKTYFDKEQEFEVSYDKTTKRFTVNPKNKDLIYSIVEFDDRGLIDNA